MALFQDGKFTSHSGLQLPYKINCDGFGYDDWDCCAKIIARHVDFGSVEGIPTGGTRLAQFLQSYTRPRKHTNIHLIVDDVFTTGGSMSESYTNYKSIHHHTDVYGYVVFARFALLPWVRAICRVTEQ